MSNARGVQLVVIKCVSVKRHSIDPAGRLEFTMSGAFQPRRAAGLIAH